MERLQRWLTPLTTPVHPPVPKWTNEAWNWLLKSLVVGDSFHNWTTFNMLQQLFCSQLQIKHQLTGKSEPWMNLTGVLSSAVHSWWVSCLTTSNQPASRSLANQAVYDSSHEACDRVLNAHRRAHSLLHADSMQSHSTAWGFPPSPKLHYMCKEIPDKQVEKGSL